MDFPKQSTGTVFPRRDHRYRVCATPVTLGNTGTTACHLFDTGIRVDEGFTHDYEEARHALRERVSRSVFIEVSVS